MKSNTKHQNTATSLGEIQSTEGGGAARGGPPSVLRGANSHEIGIDWIRVVADSHQIQRIQSFLLEQYGMCVQCKGLHTLALGLSWQGGLRLSFDEEPPEEGGAKFCTVEVPGQFLQGLDFQERIELLRSLLTFETSRCTRLDIALDWKGQGIALIDHLADSAAGGELCGAKRHGRHQEHTDGMLVNDGFTVGQKGKNGSGRYIRVYDKGLEQRQPDETPNAGAWVRWEVEFGKAKGKGRQGLAHQVAEDLLAAEDPAEEARAHALGAVEFRLANGRRKRDRPLCDWWLAFIDGTSVKRCTVRREKPSFASWAGWMKRCVLPRVQSYAEVLGITPQQFTDRHIGRVAPKFDLLTSTPAFWQFIRGPGKSHYPT